MKTFKRLPKYARQIGLRGLVKFLYHIPLGIAAKQVRHCLNLTQQQIGTMNIRGYSHPVYVRAGTTDMWVVQEILLDEEYQCDLSDDPEVIIDAGANIGCTSVYYANKYPDALIIAIEPERSNYEMLLKNIEHYPNVRPINAALWWNHVSKLSVREDGCHAGFAFEPNENGNINTVTIGDLFNRYGRIDILKLDIEGAERQILENADGWIDRVGLIGR